MSDNMDEDDVIKSLFVDQDPTTANMPPEPVAPAKEARLAPGVPVKQAVGLELVELSRLAEKETGSEVPVPDLNGGNETLLVSPVEEQLLETLLVSTVAEQLLNEALDLEEEELAVLNLVQQGLNVVTNFQQQMLGLGQESGVWTLHSYTRSTGPSDWIILNVPRAPFEPLTPFELIMMDLHSLTSSTDVVNTGWGLS